MSTVTIIACDACGRAQGDKEHFVRIEVFSGYLGSEHATYHACSAACLPTVYRQLAEQADAALSLGGRRR